MSPVKPEAAVHGGAQSARGQRDRSSAEARRHTYFGRAAPPGLASEACDVEIARAINRLWFEELKPEDWWTPNHKLDDRIEREFGSTQVRAARGELQGWASRRETCLALVVTLDQISRILHRGTPQATACDRMARDTALHAMARGDDRAWPRGPRRLALYMPFLHSENPVDKKKFTLLMRCEGLSNVVLPRACASDAPAGAVPVLQSPRRGGKALPLPLLCSAPGSTPSNKTTPDARLDVWSDGDSGSEAESDGPWVSAVRPTGGWHAPPQPHTACAAESRNKRGRGQVYSIEGAVEAVPRLERIYRDDESARLYRDMRLNAVRQVTKVKRAQIAYMCKVCDMKHTGPESSPDFLPGPGGGGGARRRSDRVG